MQAFNEVTVIIISYILVIFCDNNIDFIMRYKLGYFYILFSSSNIIYNLYNMLKELFTVTLKNKMQKCKNDKDQKEYEKKI
jgi:hypothetical protein